MNDGSDCRSIHSLVTFLCFTGRFLSLRLFLTVTVNDANRQLYFRPSFFLIADLGLSGLDLTRIDVCSMFARMPRYRRAARGIRSPRRIRATAQNGMYSHHLIAVHVEESNRAADS